MPISWILCGEKIKIKNNIFYSFFYVLVRKSNILLTEYLSYNKLFMKREEGRDE